VDLQALERMLQSKTYGVDSGRLRMGAFSAVSNVTGLIADVDAIAILLHRYHCLAFFDYASGAPYLKMNMNPTVPAAAAIDGGDDRNDPSKDAIYFSPHKCYGGTSSPGVLIVKKRLVSQTNPPKVSGGGTVFYVTNESHRFLSNRVERYEVRETCLVFCSFICRSIPFAWSDESSVCLGFIQLPFEFSGSCVAI
jgi:selenocysteine lyase/cysteine desulfurase